MKLGNFSGWLFLGVALIFSGCSKDWHSAEREFENRCWNVSDTLSLSFENTDTAAVYELAFPITVNEDYPFHNLYLRVKLQAPSGDASIIPTEFVLADPNGSWLSEPSGDVVPFRLKVPEGIRFSQKGNYTMKLYHFMRDADLCGVEKAGIAVNPMVESN
jgi:gliding motility-associated lipoprotein GldH